MLFHVGHNRDFIIELSSQILNAIFTLMAVSYSLPYLIYEFDIVKVSNHPLRLWDVYNFFKGPGPKYTHNLRKRYPLINSNRRFSPPST
jgi:hypothetical protein